MLKSQIPLNKITRQTPLTIQTQNSNTHTFTLFSLSCNVALLD